MIPTTITSDQLRGALQHLGLTEALDTGLLQHVELAPGRALITMTRLDEDGEIVVTDDLEILTTVHAVRIAT